MRAGVTPHPTAPERRLSPPCAASLSRKGRGAFLTSEISHDRTRQPGGGEAVLRVEHEAEDGLIQTLIDAARARVEGEVGLTLTSTSAAPLRLAILMLALRAYERGEVEMSIRPVEAWIAPYRVVRL